MCIYHYFLPDVTVILGKFKSMTLFHVCCELCTDFISSCRLWAASYELGGPIFTAVDLSLGDFILIVIFLDYCCLFLRSVLSLPQAVLLRFAMLMKFNVGLPQVNLLYCSGASCLQFTLRVVPLWRCFWVLIPNCFSVLHFAFSLACFVITHDTWVLQVSFLVRKGIVPFVQSFRNAYSDICASLHSH